ncbi:arginyltransferase [Aestuariibacter sp. AA17]|uniref:Aspartate/glutamate leucyltransferase n=1 Tax=Fluctibacter corallii TaxID=2984329 RepID=A0ABT3A6R6_9ALTE|nr:arginyltransferase [Aestuariibacter sp. AA17]MCV2884267.1 arginyltransferase [Aestuariibacter sp. AA17]
MRFGLTQEFDCSYLSDQREQLLVLVENEQAQAKHYDILIGAGFRRSGEQIYRPHCTACHACQSLRVLASSYSPSKSQKRITNKNSDITVVASLDEKPAYYTLYARYINTRHRDGSMYPASEHQYRSFISSQWCQTLFFEFYHHDKLIGVAVTDLLANALSALYTFFDPDYTYRSVGKFAIIKQIEYARKKNIPYVYLGYQIDACEKMNYKREFYPHERFIDNKWHYFSKK